MRKLALAGLAAAGLLGAGIDRQQAPFVRPAGVQLPWEQQNRRKDPRDKKRKKPLRAWLKKVLKPKARRPDERFMLAIKRERQIGVHPKYRHSHARRRGPTPAEWESIKSGWNDRHGLRSRT